MALEFINKLKDIKQTAFKFTSFEKRMTMSDNDERKAYLVFTLESPIDRVVGSTILHDPADYLNTVKVSADDVTEVICMMDLIEKYEDEWTFEMDAAGELTRQGSYHGNMVLDVSSRKREVWLTDTKLSKFGQDKRHQNRVEQYNRFFGKKD